MVMKSALIPACLKVPNNMDYAITHFLPIPGTERSTKFYTAPPVESNYGVVR